MKSVELKTKLDEMARQKRMIDDAAAKEICKYLEEKMKSGNTDDIYKQLFEMTSQFSTESKAIIFALALQRMCVVAGNQKKMTGEGSFKGLSSPGVTKKQQPRQKSIMDNFFG